MPKFDYGDFEKKLREKINRPRGQAAPVRPLLATLKNRRTTMRNAALKPPDISK